jgi:hypothetical protein
MLKKSSVNFIILSTIKLSILNVLVAGKETWRVGEKSYVAHRHAAGDKSNNIGQLKCLH